MQEQKKHGDLTQKLYHATDTTTCIANKDRVELKQVILNKY